MTDKKTKNPIQTQQAQKNIKKHAKKANSKVIFGVMVLMVSTSIFLQRLICQNWQSLGETVFGIKTLQNQSVKFTVLKKAMLYIAGLQFFIALFIMHIRIFGQYINPVADKDPLLISVLNRVLSNTLQQSIVFFGLYAYLLIECSSEIQCKHILGLPLMFLIGRIVFAISYVFATFVGISTFRSVGFAFVIGVNLLMFELIFKHSNFLNSFLFN